MPFNEEERIYQQYREEFADEFKLVDKDSDSKAFDLDKQLLLLEYIDTLEKAIREKAPEEHKNELLNETAQFKKELPGLTKSKTIKRLVDILAKVRKKGLEALKEIWTEGKKEVIKRGLKLLLDNADSLMN